MKSFYINSSSDFHPISFGDTYLYSEYRKIKDFLIANNQQDLLNALAIPSFYNNQIEWKAESNHEINKLKTYSEVQQEEILSVYNDFINSYEKFLKKLEQSNNNDNDNWRNLLFSLIQGTGNELFYDGEKIFITWGWKLIDESKKKLIPSYNQKDKPQQEISNILKVEEEKEVEDIKKVYDKPVPTLKNKKIKEQKKLSLLERIYLFLKKLWWLIPSLSTIILILLLVRSCHNNQCQDLDKRIDNVNNILMNCDCMIGSIPEITTIIPCNSEHNSGEAGITKTSHTLGNKSGTVSIGFNTQNQPDKIEVYCNNILVCSTYDIKGNIDGYVGDDNNQTGVGSISFNYTAKGDHSCTVIVTGNDATQWSYNVGCPQ